MPVLEEKLSPLADRFKVFTEGYPLFPEQHIEIPASKISGQRFELVDALLNPIFQSKNT